MSRRPAGLALLLAVACTRAPEPAASPARAPESEARPGTQAEGATGPEPAVAEKKEDAAATPAGPRACRHGERLDSGCVCRDGGACFDICCGEGSGCAHPARPGGPSACILEMPGPVAKPRACTDGEALASGCRCDDTVCMDICCVGSACSHRSGPDGGFAKCMTLPKRR